MRTASKLACSAAAIAMAAAGCRSWSPHPFASSEAVPEVAQLGASRDGSRIWVQTPVDVRVMELGTGATSEALALEGMAQGLVVSSDGIRAIVASYGGALEALELRGRAIAITARAPAPTGHALQGLALSPDDAWVAAAFDDGPLVIYAAHDLERPPVSVGLTPGPVRSVAFRDDGVLMVEREQAIELFEGPPFVPVAERSKSPRFTLVTRDGDPVAVGFTCPGATWDASGRVVACLESQLRLCTGGDACKEIDLGKTLVHPRAVCAAGAGFVVAGEGPLAARVSVDGAVRTFFIDGVVDRPVGSAR